MENVVRELASSHLPSLSALLGPILAARLCVEAHGRARLARLPAGTMQILGAEKAFFNHLRREHHRQNTVTYSCILGFQGHLAGSEERSLEPLLPRQVSPLDAMHTVEVWSRSG